MHMPGGREQATKDIPAVKEMLKEAQQVLGYDLLQLCTDGPKEKLDDTKYAQVPALPPHHAACNGLWLTEFAEQKH